MPETTSEPEQTESEQTEPEQTEPESVEDRPLPFPGFADLPPHAAVAALRSLDDPRDVDAMLTFEQAHGDRPPVVAAARIRADALRGM